MKKYQKIETLFKFNQETKRFDNIFYNKHVEILKDNLWVFTEKIDGTNFRIHWDGYSLEYGGRTDRSNFSKKQKQFIETKLLNGLETTLEQIFMDKDVIIFGELFGYNIQGNLGYSDYYEFKVFDIMVNGLYLTYETTKEVCDTIGFDVVPIVMVDTIDNAISYVLHNRKSTFSNANLEGLVGKPIGNFYDRLGNRIVVKIKYRDLIKTNLKEKTNETI